MGKKRWPSRRRSPSPSPIDGWIASPIDGWIASLVKGRTFADFAGIGVDAVNERVSVALRAGAREATMIDVRPSDYFEWNLFRASCTSKGVEGYRELAEIDVYDPNLPALVGSYDLVNCTGLLDRLPSPVAALENLSRIVDEYLVIGMAIVPDHITTAAGRLHFPSNTALFLPGISEHERAVLDTYYKQKFGWSIDEHASRLTEQATAPMPWWDNGQLSYWPLWWQSPRSAASFA
jgi:hypothetical protein